MSPTIASAFQGPSDDIIIISLHKKYRSAKKLLNIKARVA